MLLWAAKSSGKNLGPHYVFTAVLRHTTTKGQHLVHNLHHISPSPAPNITIFIYKFEVPKTADSHFLVCDAELLNWCSPMILRKAPPSPSTLEDVGDTQRTVSFSFWNAPAYAVYSSTQLLVLEKLLQCTDTDPVPCSVLNPWHRTRETRLWICAVWTDLPLFLSPVLPYPGPETGLVEDTLVWSTEQFTWSKLGWGLVAKLCFGEY